MTPGQTNAVLWVAFAAASATVFAIGNMEDATQILGTYYTAGLVDAVLAGALLWRHGVSLAMPVVVVVYAVANKWFFFLLFLTLAFWSKVAP